jgi:hypothetical protein
VVVLLGAATFFGFVADGHKASVHSDRKLYQRNKKGAAEVASVGI